MTAEQIRLVQRALIGDKISLAERVANNKYLDELPAMIGLEVAAHLAEANELKRLEVEAINNLGGVVNLLTHEGSPLGKLAGSAESIAMALDILVNRGQL